jgi:hypothetical protein
MKTKLSGLCIIGCFLAIPTLYSQEIQSYPLETIAVYREGSGQAELGTIEEGRGYSGPSAPSFVLFSPVLGLNDRFNSRVAFVDSSGKWQATVVLKDSVPSGVLFNQQQDNLILMAGVSYPELYIYAPDGDKVAELFFQGNERGAPENITSEQSFGYYEYYNGLLLLKDSDNHFWSILNPGLDQAENRAKLMDTRQTREYLQATYGEAEDAELRIDEHGRLFISGRLLTYDWVTFRDYFAERTAALQPPPYAAERPFRGYLDRFNETGIKFVGFDVNDNYYWVSGQRTIFVFSETGWIKLIFRYDTNAVDSTPVVTANGDLYFYSYQGEPGTIELLTIPNTWDPIDEQFDIPGISSSSLEQPQATVINSRLRVRSAPSLEGEMLGMLEIGEGVRVLERSDQEMNIGDLTDFWYRIDNGNGLVGWAYGAFLRMEGE